MTEPTVEIRPYRPADRPAALVLAARLEIGVAPWRDPAAVRAAVTEWVRGSLDSISALLGPLLAGILIGPVGIQGLFVVCAMLAIWSAWLIWRVDYEAPPSASSTSSPTVTPPGPGAIPVPGTRTVIVSGAGARLDDDTMTMPFVTQLALAGAPVVAAEAGQDTPGGRDVFVGLVRDRAETAARVPTVDNLESFIGQAATVLAVRDLGRAPVSHYGVGPGAQRLLPETTAVP